MHSIEVNPAILKTLVAESKAQGRMTDNLARAVASIAAIVWTKKRMICDLEDWQQASVMLILKRFPVLQADGNAFGFVVIALMNLYRDYYRRHFSRRANERHAAAGCILAENPYGREGDTGFEMESGGMFLLED